MVAYAEIVTLPAVVPVSVVVIKANSSADSSQINPALASTPLSIIKPLSVADVFGESMKRIVEGTSLSSLFRGFN